MNRKYISENRLFSPGCIVFVGMTDNTDGWRDDETYGEYLDRNGVPEELRSAFTAYWVTAATLGESEEPLSDDARALLLRRLLVLARARKFAHDS